MVSTRHSIKMLGHTGGTNGYTSSFMRFPDRAAVLIVLSNLGPDGTAWVEKEAVTALASARR